jgi:hypothetical protein
MRAGWLVALVCGGCKLVADAQYDDRREELEAFRTEFLPGTDQVSAIMSADTRFYWVNRVKPLDEPMLHSYEPSTGMRIDYEFTRAKSDIATRYHMSGAMIVECGFSTANAFDAKQPNTMIATTSMMVDDACAVNGEDVYFVIGRKIRKWSPRTMAAPVDVLDLMPLGVGTGSPNFGVLGNLLLLEEGGRLWQVDLAARTATWLENEIVTTGLISFDARGVMYDTQKGISYVQLSDHSEVLVNDLLADGGYKLNGEHSDIHTLPDGSIEYGFHGRHIVYRGGKGIFAYGLDSKKVVDLLLDGNSEEFSSDNRPLYHEPTVTTDGTLFVWDRNNASGNDKPVYRVDLNGGRLK